MSNLRAGIISGGSLRAGITSGVMESFWKKCTTSSGRLLWGLYITAENNRCHDALMTSYNAGVSFDSLGDKRTLHQLQLKHSSWTSMLQMSLMWSHWASPAKTTPCVRWLQHLLYRAWMVPLESSWLLVFSRDKPKPLSLCDCFGYYSWRVSWHHQAQRTHHQTR